MITVHKASLKGKRDQNEDKHDCVLNIEEGNSSFDKTKAPINYFAVYDGHGGKFVSEYLHSHLPECFMDKRMEYPLKKPLVKKLYSYWQNELKTKHTRASAETGSTCCMVIQYKKDECYYLQVLNSGDSRAIICRNNMAMTLTRDHKPNLFEEKARITALGGEIEFDGVDWRIEGLSVSRAFGDTNAEPYLTCMPDMFKYKLTKDDKFMVVCCDGLVDVFSNDYIVNYILENCYDFITGKRINQNVNIAKKIAEHAIIKGSSDNVSVLIVFFS